MSGVQFNINVNSGASNSAIDGIISGLRNATNQSNLFTGAIGKIGQAAFHLNNIKSAISGIASDFQSMVQPGIDFNTQMKETQAISGVTDAQMQVIGKSARQLAKDFGIDATKSVESYKLILSQLGPELANTPKALEAMGRSSAILSKQLGGDTAKATEILATAMNQYGVSLKDPMAASQTMAVMMNIMSAAAQEGASEMPQIKSALEQSGMMAKTANVSFTELNSAIQVLGKSGKQGAEGGVAIRNVLANLSEGEFLPRRTKAMLAHAGIDINALGDKTKSFSERLALLKPIVSDTAAMTQMWGKENVAAGIALINGTSEMDRYTAKISGSNSANEMATTIMGSFSEKMNRVNAKLKDIGISLFDATSGFIPFVQLGMGALSVMANLAMASQLFGSIGIMSAIRGMGTMVVSMGSWIATTTMATLAQLGLNAAMYANPIGIVIAALVAVVVAIILVVKYWDVIWDSMKSFGKWMWDHNPFSWLINVVDNIFPGFKTAMEGLWKWIEGKFEALLGWFKKAFDWIKGLFGGGQDASSVADKAAVAEFSKNFQTITNIPGITTQDKNAPKNTVLDGWKPGGGKVSKGNGTSTELSSNITGGGSRPSVINITIHKMMDQIVIQTTNMKDGAKQTGEEVLRELTMYLKSVNGNVINE